METDVEHMPQAASAIDHAEIATLRLLALEGARDGEVKVSCAGLAVQLDVSNQTVSRRLQHLDDAGLIERQLVTDGQWIDLTDRGRKRLQSEYELYRRIFEDEAYVRLSGRVTAGMGEGRHYISLEGYQVQFIDRLGYQPFPGTLNVTLSEESVRHRARIEALDAIPIDEWEDEDRTYGPAACYPATVVNQAGARFSPTHVIIPERTHHDEQNLELIAPEKLRDVLTLDDDDVISVITTGDAS